MGQPDPPRVDVVGTLIGTVRGNRGGKIEVRRHDPPLPYGRYTVGHSVMDASHVRELIAVLTRALGGGGGSPAMPRLRHGP